MKAAKKFKSLLGPTRASTPIQSILGQEYETHFVEPPTQMDPEESVSLPSPIPYKKTQSLNTYNRRAWERDDVVKGYHPQRREALPYPAPDSGESGSAYSSILNKPTRKDSGSIRSVRIRDDPIDDLQSQSSQIPLSRTSSTTTKRSIEGTRGHARDPLEEDCPFLFIGPSTFTGSAPIDINSTDASAKPLNSNAPMTGGETDPIEPDYPVVSESPGAADFDIYETAYRQEIERIRADTLPGKEGKGSVPMVYLTRRVDGKDELMKLVRETTMSEPALGIGAKVAVPQDSGFRSAVSIIRTQLEQGRQGEERQQPQSQELGSLNVSETSDVKTSASTQEGATASTAATGTEPLQSDGQRGRLRSLLTRAKLSRSP